MGWSEITAWILVAVLYAFGMFSPILFSWGCGGCYFDRGRSRFWRILDGISAMLFWPVFIVTGIYGLWGQQYRGD